MVEATPKAGPGAAPQVNRRRMRSHFINGDVRLRLVVDDVLFALAAALTAIGILYYLSNREIGDTMFSAHVSIKQTRELLTNGVKVAGIVTFAAVLLFGLWSLMDAHRIAGPMHRLHRLLTEIGEGNLVHEIQFRRKDEFPELAAATDKLVETYATRLRKVRSQVDALEKALRDTDSSADEITNIRMLAADISNHLIFFRLPPPESAPKVDIAPLSS